MPGRDRNGRAVGSYAECAGRTGSGIPAGKANAGGGV